MKVYQVKIIGGTEKYFVTAKQKEVLDKALMDKNKVMVNIGGNTVRTSAIRSISETEIELDIAPEYLKEAVEKEKALMPSLDVPAYRKLPTEWIVLNNRKQIIATDVGRRTLSAIMLATCATGEHFFMAKCHYKLGENGKEYYTAEDQIAELLERRVDPDYPYDAPIVSVMRYGMIK